MAHSLGKTIVSNSVLLLVTRVLSKLSTIAVTVYAARSLGKESFGVYSAILAMTSLAGSVSDFGLVLPTIRSISKKSGNEGELVAETFSARSIWSFVAIVAMFVVGYLLKIQAIIIFLFALSSILEVSANALVRSFEGRQEMKTVTIFTLVERFSFFIFVLGMLLFFPGLEMLALAYILSFGIMFIYAVVLFQKRFGKLHLSFSITKLKSYSLVGLPFFVTVIFSAIYYKADTLMLSALRSDAEVGIYNAALRIIDSQTFIPLTIMTSIFPMLSQLHNENDPRFFIVFKRSFIAFMGIGVLISCLVYFTAPYIIQLLYSVTYNEAVGVLKILSLLLPCYFVNVLVSQSLIALNREVLFTVIMIGSAVLNILGNYFFIPIYGYIGAAWVRVAVECIFCIIGIILLLYNLRVLSIKNKREEKRSEHETYQQKTKMLDVELFR